MIVLTKSKGSPVHSNADHIPDRFGLTSLKNLLLLSLGGFIGSFYWVSPYLGRFWAIIFLAGCVLVVLSIPCLTLGWLLKKPAMYRSWSSAFLIYLGVLLGGVVEVVGFTPIDLRITKLYCESFVPKLSDYYKEHGSYPTALRVSFFENLMAPGLASRSGTHAQICDYRIRANSFEFNIETGIFSGLMFLPESNRWEPTGD